MAAHPGGAGLRDARAGLRDARVGQLMKSAENELGNANRANGLKERVRAVAGAGAELRPMRAGGRTEAGARAVTVGWSRVRSPTDVRTGRAGLRSGLRGWAGC